MSTYESECDECGRPIVQTTHDAEHQDICFKCKISSLGFKFKGVRGGRESFHDDTLRSAQEEIVRDAAAQGRTVRPKEKKP